jgi:hypothetical protein
MLRNGGEVSADEFAQVADALLTRLQRLGDPQSRRMRKRLDDGNASRRPCVFSGTHGEGGDDRRFNGNALVSVMPRVTNDQVPTIRISSTIANHKCATKNGGPRQGAAAGSQGSSGTIHGATSCTVTSSMYQPRYSGVTPLRHHSMRTLRPMAAAGIGIGLPPLATAHLASDSLASVAV